MKFFRNRKHKGQRQLSLLHYHSTTYLSESVVLLISSSVNSYSLTQSSPFPSQFSKTSVIFSGKQSSLHWTVTSYFNLWCWTIKTRAILSCLHTYLPHNLLRKALGCLLHSQLLLAVPSHWFLSSGTFLLKKLLKVVLFL